MDFYDRDIVSIKDFTREEIEALLDLSEKMVPYAMGEKTWKPLSGRILGNLFFEPSTRTRLSFESAAHRLGANVIDVSEMSMTSISKGETLADTIRMVDAYCDAIVLRHLTKGPPDWLPSSPSTCDKRRDGAGSHPTQTLLDLSP